MTEKQINARAKSTDACLNCKQNIKIDGCALSRSEKPSSKKKKQRLKLAHSTMNRYSRQVRPLSSASLILDFHAPLTTIFSPALPH